MPQEIAGCLVYNGTVVYQWILCTSSLLTFELFYVRKEKCQSLLC